jgi:choloylglycine hydrolase
MKRLAVLSVAVISLTAFLPVVNAEACTRMFWNTNGKVMLVGRNMDLNIDDKPIFYVFPEGISKNGGVDVNPAKWTSLYGSLVVAGFGSSNYTWEGINTAGLCFHALYLGVSQYENRHPRRPGVLQLRFGEYLLDNAATVSEALTLMYQTQLVPELLYGSKVTNHYALEDASGDAAIIEFVGGQMNVYHGAEFTTLTNDPPLPQMPDLLGYQYFGGSLPLPGDLDPASRFVRASAFLSTLDTAFSNPDPNYPKPTRATAIFSAIRSLAEPFGAVMPYGESNVPDWPTLWTAVSDLTNKKVYFSHYLGKNNFWIDMRKLNFRKGAPILSLKAYRPGLAREVSGLFRPL